MDVLRRTIAAMRYLPLLAVFLAGCSFGGGNSPTAPTPPPTIINHVPAVTPTPAPTTPAPTPAPTPSAPTRNALLDDPRFNLNFYRMFVNNAFEAPTQLQPLRRHSQPPRIYLRTIMDTGASIDAVTLDITAAALINTAGSLTGVFGLADLERGTSDRLGQPGWITVEWRASATVDRCGDAFVGGDSVRLYPNVRGCRCSGNRAVIDMATVKHELGHALGYWHTDEREGLMYHINEGQCDQNPSDREIFHARVAYSQPIGSYDPR